VRIDPLHFGDDTGEVDGLLGVKFRRKSVMRPHGQSA